MKVILLEDVEKLLGKKKIRLSMSVTGMPEICCFQKNWDWKQPRRI